MTVYKVLVCNDDTSLLKMIEWSLKDRGYAVMTVTRARDAIAALHRNHFDVVLTDMDKSPMTQYSVLPSKARGPRDHRDFARLSFRAELRHRKLFQRCG